eukprot:gene3983-7935_t
MFDENTLLHAQQMLEENEDMIASVIENLQLGRLDDCFSQYAILQKNLVSMALALDNFPADDIDPYEANYLFPDEIMRKDVLDELRPAGHMQMPKLPLPPPCNKCASQKYSSEKCRRELDHVDLNHRFSDTEKIDFLHVTQVLEVRNRQKKGDGQYGSGGGGGASGGRSRGGGVCKRVYRRWTPHEKHTVCIAMSLYGDKNYRTIASLLEERTIEQVRGYIFKTFTTEDKENFRKGIVPAVPPKNYEPPRTLLCSPGFLKAFPQYTGLAGFNDWTSLLGIASGVTMSSSAFMPSSQLLLSQPQLLSHSTNQNINNLNTSTSTSTSMTTSDDTVFEVPNSRPSSSLLYRKAIPKMTTIVLTKVPDLFTNFSSISSVGNGHSNSNGNSNGKGRGNGNGSGSRNVVMNSNEWMPSSGNNGSASGNGSGSGNGNHPMLPKCPVSTISPAMPAPSSLLDALSHNVNKTKNTNPNRDHRIATGGSESVSGSDVNTINNIASSATVAIKDTDKVIIHPTSSNHHSRSLVPSQPSFNPNNNGGREGGPSMSIGMKSEGGGIHGGDDSSQRHHVMNSKGTSRLAKPSRNSDDNNIRSSGMGIDGERDGEGGGGGYSPCPCPSPSLAKGRGRGNRGGVRGDNNNNARGNSNGNSNGRGRGRGSKNRKRTGLDGSNPTSSTAYTSSSSNAHSYETIAANGHSLNDDDDGPYSTIAMQKSSSSIIYDNNNGEEEGGDDLTSFQYGGTDTTSHYLKGASEVEVEECISRSNPQTQELFSESSYLLLDDDFSLM